MVDWNSGVMVVVRKGGLEPPHLSVPDPKSGASANSATFANSIVYRLENLPSFRLERKQRSDGGSLTTGVTVSGNEAQRSLIRKSLSQPVLVVVSPAD